MKIGIDISQIAHEGTGVACYTRSLIDSLLRYDKKNEYIFFYASLRKKCPIDVENIKKFPIPPTLLSFLWNDVHIMPIESCIGDVDIFISSDWTQPPTRKAKKLTIVHDLVVYKFPETSHPTIISTQKKRLARVQSECDYIIADSHSTRTDIIDILNIPENKISVVYPSVTVSKPAVKKTNRPFILSVGKIEPRKNIARLISAYKKSGVDMDLIIVGPEGWNSQDLDKTNVRFLGFVPDEDLYALYSAAEFFVYPSLYEGFGYPVIEAMALGCPVATSNTSSLKELAENCGLLFNPLDEEDITKAIIKLAGNTKLRTSLGEKGRVFARKFSQKEFADTMMDIFNIIH